VFIEDFGIRVDRAGDVPVGVQLAWALRGAVESGLLRAGDRLPPLRELAEEVGVNANTLRAAYAKLEADGLIETRHGSGTYVALAPARRDLSALVGAASRAARDAGVDPRELAAALYVSSSEEREPDSEAHRRRAGRRTRAPPARSQAPDDIRARGRPRRTHRASDPDVAAATGRRVSPPRIRRIPQADRAFARMTTAGSGSRPQPGRPRSFL